MNIQKFSFIKLTLGLLAFAFMVTFGGIVLGIYLNSIVGIEIFRYFNVVANYLGFGDGEWLLYFLLLVTIGSLCRYIGLNMLENSQVTFKIGIVKSLSVLIFIAIGCLYLASIVLVISLLTRSYFNDIPFGNHLMENLRLFFNSVIFEAEYQRYAGYIWNNLILLFFAIFFVECTHQILIRTLYPKYIEPYFDGWISLSYKSNKKDIGFLSTADEYEQLKLSLKHLKTFSPIKFFKKNRTFIGKDVENNSLVYIEDKQIIERTLPHFSIVGASGSGKGAFSQAFLVQMSRKGFPVIVFDPNKDNHMMNNLKYHADQMGKQFYWVNFEDYQTPQIDLLQGCSPYEFIQLTNMMFPALKVRDSDGNYYAQFSRYARELYAEEAPSAQCMYDLHQKVFNKHGEEVLKDDDGRLPQFVNEFLAMSKLGMMRVKEGVSIQEIIQNGDVLYISCPDLQADDALALMCRALFLRTLQIIKVRDEEAAKHVFLFVDEFAEFANKMVKTAIEQVRKKGCTLLMNMTSFESLKGITDVDPQAFLDTVKINSIKLIFAQPDADIAHKASQLTGDKIIKVEREHIKRNEALKEIQQVYETYQMPTKVPLYSSGILANLPVKVGVLLGVGLPKMIQIEVLYYPNNIDKPKLFHAEGFPLAEAFFDANKKDQNPPDVMDLL